jgi:glycosyltransferase involved in cell wall biosynthesis
MLVQYWRDEFNYKGEEFLNYVVIPCTVNDNVFISNISPHMDLRTKYNYTEDDIILVYSGSAESWQSFYLIDQLLGKLLEQNEKIKVLFMAKIDLSSLNVYNSYKSRIKKMWVDPSEVTQILSMCDYGLLIREKTVTNQVASPTKFAEYLASGLKVLISENVGDFSKLVEKNNLGIVIKPNQEIEKIRRQNKNEKQIIIEFAKSHFQKSVFDNEYRVLINRLSNL